MGSPMMEQKSTGGRSLPQRLPISSVEEMVSVTSVDRAEILHAEFEAQLLKDEGYEDEYEETNTHDYYFGLG